mmetsp:Transcript_25415/g.33182  ORF Transcript_25415/g.33182 Transcript_25415/m.33182 type:complete len:178 (+) Transcript_25415:169-702(+)|eukprot:CAMPEP_0117743022 /NCGR_PEP_ID=MMETSP0947-20121206/5879_1 /TAXON_ID=44440 /ORGANISM="Chattonella subsalsa, Strain CCMP2191" /LENGTH=177 /DNA_ID=CAMNT_0005559627 /DNA_START=1806 /DNA_END=2339 /DNA_ORIENTATION=-
MDVPKLIVFDLDYTMWDPEMYLLDGGAPFSYQNGRVFDRYGTEVDLFPDVRNILWRINSSEEFQDTKIGSASRTEYPDWAEECMQLLDVRDGLKMKDFFTYNEIYPGTKTSHFRKLQKASQIPFEEMLFFDDCSWNCRDVARLGVTTYNCPQGLSEREFDEALEVYARKKADGSPSS